MKRFGYVTNVSDIVTGTDSQDAASKMITVKINPYDPETGTGEMVVRFNQFNGDKEELKNEIIYKAFNDHADALAALMLKKDDLVEFDERIYYCSNKGFGYNRVYLSGLKRYEQPKQTPAFP